MTIKREKRVASSLNEAKAEALLKRKALLDACTSTVTVLDEEKIYGALYQEDEKASRS